MSTASSQSGDPHRLIKCVVWDLDNTLWPGVAVEGRSEDLPQVDPGMLKIISELEKRGIVSSIASRNDPSMKDLLLGHAELAGKLVAPQVSWAPKSEAVRRIARELNIELDSIAFVDDSEFERAEVGFALPGVMLLAPDEIDGAIESPAFQLTSITGEGERRVEMYRQEGERKAAEAHFGGSRAEFLEWCRMRLRIEPATENDLGRIMELTERTHQLNSTGRQYGVDELSERIADERWLMPVARLTDRFGDYGLVGSAIVDRVLPWPPQVWLAELVMLSCRVEGRGIPSALLTWIMGEAKKSGMSWLRAVYRVNRQNVPMRLLFRQMGFKSVGGGELIVAARDLAEPLPEYPEWLHVEAPSEITT